MRKAGLNAAIYEAGTSFGGTWRWNVYPGARVDSPVPIYELSIPEVYKDWHWTTNYPNWEELQGYFDHMDKVLNLSKDCSFETVVTSAEFDTEEGKWNVGTQDGRKAKAKHLVVCAGFAAKRYIPGFPSMDKFKGTIHHSSFWPVEGVPYGGKRVAIIGTGASGVQMIQVIFILSRSYMTTPLTRLGNGTDRKPTRCLPAHTKPCSTNGQASFVQGRARCMEATVPEDSRSA